MTRLQIIENTSFEIVEKIAAKLHNDGLTVDTFTMTKAKSIIGNTCGALKLLIILEEFEGVVKYHMNKFEK